MKRTVTSGTQNSSKYSNSDLLENCNSPVQNDQRNKCHANDSNLEGCFTKALVFCSIRRWMLGFSVESCTLSTCFRQVPNKVNRNLQPGEVGKLSNYLHRCLYIPKKKRFIVRFLPINSTFLPGHPEGFNSTYCNNFDLPVTEVSFNWHSFSYHVHKILSTSNIFRSPGNLRDLKLLKSCGGLTSAVVQASEAPTPVTAAGNIPFLGELCHL